MTLLYIAIYCFFVGLTSSIVQSFIERRRPLTKYKILQSYIVGLLWPLFWLATAVALGIGFIRGD